MKNSRQYRAFTLLELLIVVTIIVLLLALLLPTVVIVRSQARAAKCASNLHGIATAIQTLRAQNGLNGAGNANFGLLDLMPYLGNNSQALICPEDIVGPTIANFNAQIAVYGTGLTNFQYNIEIKPDAWCYQSTLNSGTYALNFEDQRDPSNPNGAGDSSDNSYYNFYLRMDSVPGGINMTSLAQAASFDVRPPGATQGGPFTNINGGDSYNLVDLNNNVLLSNWTRGDPRVAFVSTGWCSYGMNSLYPFRMTTPSSDVIAVLDYLIPTATVAGPNLDAGEWDENMTPNPAQVGNRPGLARHRGRFNALYMDNSVRININPSVVSPDLSTQIRQKWWGGT